MEYASNGGVLSLMYGREKGTPIKFGGTLNMKAQVRKDLDRETLGNHTVLSTLNKKNIEVPLVMKELYDWIKTHVLDLDSCREGGFLAEQAETNPKLKSLVLELLNKADSHISDFTIVDAPIYSELEREMKNDDEFLRFIKPYICKRFILFTHVSETKDFLVNYESESEGTKAYFRLARLLFDLKNNGYVLLEDELEDSLHYYLQTYLQSEGRSQLLFTTHNQLLFDEDWMIAGI